MTKDEQAAEKKTPRERWQDLLERNMRVLPTGFIGEFEAILDELHPKPKPQPVTEIHSGEFHDDAPGDTGNKAS